MSDELKLALKSFYETYNANYVSQDAITALQKTFQTHNITIEDWNSMLEFLKSEASTNAGFVTFLNGIVDEIDSIESNQTNMINAIGNKVSKSSEHFKVYGTDSAGNQIMIPYGTDINALSIAMRTGDGSIVIPLQPQANNEAASKKYVDDMLGNHISNWAFAYPYVSGQNYNIGEYVIYNHLIFKKIASGNASPTNNLVWQNTMITDVLRVLENTKVSKTSTAYKVYGTDYQGNQAELTYSTGTTGGALVRRDGSGNIAVPTPTSNVDAANKAYVDSATSGISSLTSSVQAIESLIPEQATSSNQLADKDFVNSSIATQTSNFLGTFNLVTDLSLTTSATHSDIASAIATKLASLSITPTNNDYVFVGYPDAVQSGQYTQFDRYKYDGSTWSYEYTLNNSSFTAEQWAAINSGITAAMISEIYAHLAEGNPGIPSGVNPTILSNLKIGNNYYLIPSLPTVGSSDKDKYLHTNSSTGDLEWVTVSQGSTYSAGTGIDITSGTISVDNSVVALQSDLPSGEIDMNINDSSTTATAATLSNIVVGNSTTGYTRYSVPIGMSNPMTTAGDLIVGGTASGGVAVPNRLPLGNAGQVLTVAQGYGAVWSDPAVPNEIGYLTTAPSSANTSGTLKIVVLSSEPSTKYSGYLYIITGSN